MYLKQGDYIFTVGDNNEFLLSAPTFVDKYLTIQDTNHYISIPNYLYPWSNGYSIELTVRFLGFSNAGRIIDLSNNTSTGGGIGAYVTLVGAIGMRINGSTSMLSANNTVQVNVWHHIVITQTAGGYAIIHVDGVIVVSGSLQPPSYITSLNDIRIANRSGAVDRPTLMDVLYCRLWNIVLTTEEINTLKISLNNTILTPDMMGWWKIDEGEDVNLYDSTPALNNALTIGGIWKTINEEIII